MCFDDSMGDRQAEPGAFARVFRGEEGFEDALERGGIHAATVIADTQQYKRSGTHARLVDELFRSVLQRSEPHGDPPSMLRQGMPGVRAKIHDDLMDLRFVGHDRQALVTDLGLDTHHGRHGRAHQLHSGGYHGLQPRGDEFPLLHPAEGQNLLDQILGVTGRSTNAIDPLAGCMSFRQVEACEFDIAQHAGKNIVEVMSDTAGKVAE